VRFLLLSVLLILCAPAVSASESAKSAGRAFVKDVKEAGKEIGHAGAKLGREVGHAAAEGGREVARVSTQAAKDVRRVTVDYWDRALAAKRRKVAELKKENRELKRERER
jgi:histone H3/H4